MLAMIALHKWLFYKKGGSSVSVDTKLDHFLVKAKTLTQILTF